MAKNIYTTQFATRAEVHTEIDQTATSITTMVSETYERRDHAENSYSQLQQTASSISATVENNNTKANIIAKINDNTSQAVIEADNISLAGKIINISAEGVLGISSNNFSVDASGNVTMNGATLKNKNFSVDSNGNMKCSNANVSGTINSNNATITGGSIDLIGLHNTITRLANSGINVSANNKDFDLGFALDQNNNYVPFFDYSINSQVMFSIGENGVWLDEDFLLKADGIIEVGDCRLNGKNGNVTVGSGLYIDNGLIRSQYTYNNSTVTNSPNMYITSGGGVRRTTNTSSKRYKTDIKNVEETELNPEKLYKLPVRQFKYKTDYLKTETDPRYDKVLIGFIAEEVAEYYPIAVDYEIDEEGNKYIENWNEKYMIPPMLNLIQKLNKRVKILEEKLKGGNE